MKAPEMNLTHNVMTCPACGSTITAEVTIQPNLGEPTLGTTGATVSVPVEPTIEKFRVMHHCAGRVEVRTPDAEATS